VPRVYTINVQLSDGFSKVDNQFKLTIISAGFLALKNIGPPRFIDENDQPIIGSLGEIILEPSIEKSFKLPPIKDPD
jgi:hypothetical protein